jgi:hypothetical protein
MVVKIFQDFVPISELKGKSRKMHKKSRKTVLPTKIKPKDSPTEPRIGLLSEWTQPRSQSVNPQGFTD